MPCQRIQLIRMSIGQPGFQNKSPCHHQQAKRCAKQLPYRAGYAPIFTTLEVIHHRQQHHDVNKDVAEKPQVTRVWSVRLFKPVVMLPQVYMDWYNQYDPNEERHENAARALPE